MNKKISIVIATINRKKEISYLLDSIEMQKYDNLEIIIVDQNKKIDLTDVINKYKESLPIQHYKVNFKGVARARNYGAEKATGEIINFTDDDSEYVSDLLEFVNNTFKNETKIDAIFGGVKDKNSDSSILKFKKQNTKVRKFNIYQTTIEGTMFIKLDVFKKSGMYDEMLGVGTYFGAEEGADLVCRLLYEKYNLQYYSKIFVYHPNKRNEELVKRAYKYNLGFGAFVYKHIKKYKKIYPAFIFLILKNIKSIYLIIIGLITNNKCKIRYSCYCLAGRKQGIKKFRKYEK